MTTAHAEEGFYLSAGGGVVFPTHSSNFTTYGSTVKYPPVGSTASTFNLPSVKWNNGYDSGYLIDLAMGSVIFTNWRIEGEYLYQHMNRNITGSYDWNQLNTNGGDSFATQNGNNISKTSTSGNFYSLLVNLIRDFKTNSKFTPYVGLGFGFMWAKSPSTTVQDTLQVNDLTTSTQQATIMQEISPAYSGASYAWQFKAGVNFKMTDHLSLDAQYRLYETSKIQATSSSITHNPNTANQGFFQISSKEIRGILNNTINLTLRYSI